MMKHWISYRLDEAVNCSVALRVYYKHEALVAHYLGYCT